MGFADLDVSALGLVFGDSWGSGCAARLVTVQTRRPSLAEDDGPEPICRSLGLNDRVSGVTNILYNKSYFYCYHLFKNMAMHFCVFVIVNNTPYKVKN